MFLSFYVATLAQSQPNCFGTDKDSSETGRYFDRYPIREIFLVLLRLGYGLQEQAVPLQAGLISTLAFLIAHIIALMYHADRS